MCVAQRVPKPWWGISWHEGERGSGDLRRRAHRRRSRFGRLLRRLSRMRCRAYQRRPRECVSRNALVRDEQLNGRCPDS